MRDERSNVGPPATVDRPRIRRRRRVEGRAGRWDAYPALTTRDAAAIRFVGEHYAVRSDVLAVVLGRLSPAMPQAPGMLGMRTLRQRLGRWQQAGWVQRRRLLGHTWVLPTRTGLRLAGLEFDCWEPAESRLAHHHAVALVRLAREPIPGASGWVCERELWRRRGRASWHLADGAMPAPVPAGWQGIDQAWELVEVELHQKARPGCWPRSRPGRRTPPASPTTSPPPCTPRCRRSSPGWSRSWAADPKSEWSRSRRCPAWATCTCGVMPRELASRGPAELGRLGAA
jgi:hypothetical protein